MATPGLALPIVAVAVALSLVPNLSACWAGNTEGKVMRMIGSRTFRVVFNASAFAISSVMLNVAATAVPV